MSLADAIHDRIWARQLVRGISLLILGIIAFALPFFTLLTLALLVAVIAILEGIACFSLGGISGYTSRRGSSLVATIGILSGVLVLLAPFVATALLSTIALLGLSGWCLLAGLSAILEDRPETPPAAGRATTLWWGLVMTAIGLTIPIILWLEPASFAALSWVFAITASFLGISLISQALTLRHAANRSGKAEDSRNPMWRQT